MLESTYQRRLIVELRHRFPGCIVLKNDTDYLQGIPDLTIFWHENWAMLEVKTSATAPNQPNQEYYIELMNELSFASFIWPAIEEEVLYALQQSFQSRRQARVSKSK